MRAGSARRIPPSSWLDHRDGTLEADGVPLSALAAAHGTPTWVYSARAIDESFGAIDRAFGPSPRLIAYAVKANGSLAILARIARLGGGADIVSAGELSRCLESGIEPSRIVFSGAGKRADEIEAAVDSGIRALHVEVVEEVDLLASIARRRGIRFPIALRVNPEVVGGAHRYIATGETDTKFGLDMATVRALLPKIASTPEVTLRGLACHVGSQLHRARPVRVAVERLASLAVELRGAGFPIEDLDIGGGLPIDYGDTTRIPDGPLPFARAVESGLRAAGLSRQDITLLVEPGRAIVGESGVLLTRVLYVKDQPAPARRSHGGPEKHRFVIVDAGMNELIRPALYAARHAIVCVRERAPSAPTGVVDVVGPVCESADFLAERCVLPADVSPGELLVVRSAGAYGSSMSSTYNGRPRAAEVMVGEGADVALAGRVVRDRERIEDLWRGERI